MTSGIENITAFAREHVDDFRASPGMYVHQGVIANLIGCDLEQAVGRASLRNFVAILRKNLLPQEYLLTMQGCDGLVYARDVNLGDVIEPAGFRSDPFWFTKKGGFEPLLRQAMKGVRSVQMRDHNTAIPLISNREYEYFLYLAFAVDPNNHTKPVSVKEFTTALGISETSSFIRLNLLQSTLNRIPNMPLQLVNLYTHGYRLEPKNP